MLCRGLPSGHPISVWMQPLQRTLIAALDLNMMVDLPPAHRCSVQVAMLKWCFWGGGL